VRHRESSDLNGGDFCGNTIIALFAMRKIMMLSRPWSGRYRLRWQSFVFAWAQTESLSRDGTFILQVIHVPMLGTQDDDEIDVV